MADMAIDNAMMEYDHYTQFEHAPMGVQYEEGIIDEHGCVIGKPWSIASMFGSRGTHDPLYYHREYSFGSVIAETDKAYRFKMPNNVAVWVPKSLCKQLDMDTRTVHIWYKFKMNPFGDIDAED